MLEGGHDEANGFVVTEENVLVTLGFVGLGCVGGLSEEKTS